jgi:5-formyltetrahydrofolate cyclo-ligase
MKKRDIRKIELDKRIKLSQKELQEKTNRIIFQFNKVDVDNVKYLLSYSPLQDRNEFDVSNCVQVIKEKSPTVIVTWPKIVVNSTNLEAHTIGEEKLFIKNKFNILEPLDGDIIPPQLLDMIFVPLIAFDKKGYRVGYGRGFYDRYLPACRPDVVKVGFSFFEAIDSIEDINEFDVPLNLCITPTCIYEF